ncbi:MAG TPA: aminotransferase class V-fold PLP-dependent enzyme, partial [Patescibacteria group bacterium]
DSVSFKKFLTSYPTYKKTSVLDKLRAKDYQRLDKNKQIYLDYTGGSLYGESQVDEHLKLLKNGVFGNPHSNNPTSLNSTKLVKEAKEAVLKYFNAASTEYCVVFTSNASNALKLVGESYPFGKGSSFLIASDNHNSVNGIREFAKSKGASVTYVESDFESMRIDENELESLLKKRQKGKNNLFAYPAQSNFSGVQYPLNWIELAQKEGWDVLLDAAAFVPTNKLDLSIYKPDFVSMSFYKMFGYPTGIGCLIAKKEALSKLTRPWFAGGTIWTASVKAKKHIFAPFDEAFEDGTVNYLGIPAVTIGLERMKEVGINVIHERVQILTDWTLKRMQEVKHNTGKPLFVIYGPKDIQDRGGTIAFNFLDPKGNIVDERIVEKYANKRNISLRNGCFCNPGAGEIAFNLKEEKLSKVFEKRTMKYESYLKYVGMKSGGAIRLSLGIVSNFNDICEFFEFSKLFQDKLVKVVNLRDRGHC